MTVDLLTLGDVARRLNEPRTRVQYAVEKANIRHRCRAGILRLYSVDQLPVIQAALMTIKGRKRIPVDSVGDVT